MKVMWGIVFFVLLLSVLGCDNQTAYVIDSNQGVVNDTSQTPDDEALAEKLCAHIICSGFGECMVKDGVPYCECQGGYHAEGLKCIENEIPDEINDGPDNIPYSDNDLISPCKGVSCSGFGTCKVDADNNPYCECIKDYAAEGLECIEKTDPCLGVLCSGKGNCVTDADKKAECQCVEGYHAEGLACIKDESPCDNVTCGGNGDCVIDSVSGETSCDCDFGYIADGLDCVIDVTEELCSGVTCSGHGICNVTAGKAGCLCESGYTPQDTACLKDSNPCEGVTCGGKGFCDDATLPVICTCDAGYNAQGLNCVSSGNVCLGVSCSGKGVCETDGFGNPACDCNEGYSPQGLECLFEDNQCRGISCSGNGTCEVKNGYAVCVCNEGYHEQEGFACLKNDDPCSGITCSGHGSCQDLDGTAVCACDPGYSSQQLNCVKSYNPCEGITCSGHGICDGTSGSAVCLCESGYHTQNFSCVKDLDPCEGITCSGRGSCNAETGIAVCECEDGYYAQGFECFQAIDPCVGINCSNQGECTVKNNEVFCACKDGYYAQGFACLPVINPCEGVTCGGNGACEVDINNNAFCTCSQGYHSDGLDCVKDNDPCEGITCSGHGICSSVNNNPVCSCADLFAGKNCDQCVTGYHIESDSCMSNTRTVSCTNAKPANSAWTAANASGQLTQTWNFGLKKWIPEPDTCEWACKSNYCLEGGSSCLHTKQVACSPVNPPSNGHMIEEQVTITCSGDVWSSASQCIWECDATFHKESNLCVTNEIWGSCPNQKPSNSGWTEGLVGGVTYENGKYKRIWDSGQGKYLPETVAACPWSCSSTYCLYNNQCLQSRTEQCDATGVTAPAHGGIDYQNIILACKTAGTWDTVPQCAWKCNDAFTEAPGYHKNGTACDPDILWTACNNAKPVHSYWQPGQNEVYNSGTFKQTWNGSAYTPASFDCPWVCENTYHKYNNTCEADSIRVTCANSLPANAQWTGSNSDGKCTQTWDGIAYLPDPCICTWACTTPRFALGGVCVLPTGDEDGDGVPNDKEDKNKNGVVDAGETDPLNADSDFDLLTDGQEDANKNGVKDSTETSPLLADTDGDGITDYIEVNSDYVYKDGAGTVQHKKTNPLVGDTDGDSLGDGAEDINRNGKIDYASNNGYYIDPLGNQVKVGGNPIPVANLTLAQQNLCPCNYFSATNCVYPAEFNPTVADSDCNGTNDNNEPGATVCKAENLAVINEHTNSGVNYKLALLKQQTGQLGFSEYTAVTQTPSNNNNSPNIGAVFYDSNATHKIAGLVVSTYVGSGVTVGAADGPTKQREIDVADLKTGLSASFANEFSTPFVTWDNYRGERWEATMTTSSRTLKTLVNDMIKRISTKGSSASFTGLFNPVTSDSSTSWKIVWETVVKESKNVTRVITILPTSLVNDTRNMVMDDVAAGGSLGDFIAEFRNFCQTFTKETSKADIIWVVDNSGSMDGSQNAVSAAATAMVNILNTTSGLDWRLAVTSTDPDFSTSNYSCAANDTGCHTYSCNCDQWGNSCSTCWGSDDGDGVFVKRDRFTRSVAEFQDWVKLGTDGSGTEQGDLMAKRAIERHWPGGDRCTHADKCIRTDAKLIVVVMSDEHPAYICQSSGDSCSFSSSRYSEITNYLNSKNATLFAINRLPGTSGTNCGSLSYESPYYQQIATATGGSAGTICAADQTSNVQAITNSIVAKAGKYLLSQTPISSSIKVGYPTTSSTCTGGAVSNGICWINRSKSNGFDYNAQENRIIFYGTAFDYVSNIGVSYKYWWKE